MVLLDTPLWRLGSHPHLKIHPGLKLQNILRRNPHYLVLLKDPLRETRVSAHDDLFFIVSPLRSMVYTGYYVSIITNISFTGYSREPNHLSVAKIAEDYSVALEQHQV